MTFRSEKIESARRGANEMKLTVKEASYDACIDENESPCLHPHGYGPRQVVARAENDAA